ncbi:hypothetical protein HDU76_003708, partial [Blyttiomyces sp. JEL0837]
PTASHSIVRQTHIAGFYQCDCSNISVKVRQSEVHFFSPVAFDIFRQETPLEITFEKDGTTTGHVFVETGFVDRHGFRRGLCICQEIRFVVNSTGGVHLYANTEAGVQPPVTISFETSA